MGAICVSGGGNCVKFQGSTFRLFGTYVKKGTRLTVHVNNHGTRNLLMHVRSGEPPTSKLNDYKVNRRDPGFTQWTCKGVYIYWIVQADISELTSMFEFGISITSDWCSAKDYSGQCPHLWNSRPGGWCNPPTSYKGPCSKQNYFGTLVENEYANPRAKEYKVLWSESCGADWPCSTFIGNRCHPVVNYMKNARWAKSSCKDSSVCHYFSINKFSSFENRVIFFVDLSPGSHLAVETFTGTLLNKNHLNLTISVGTQNELRYYKSENTQIINWKTSVRGIAPYIELHSIKSYQRTRYFIGILNENEVKIEGGLRVYSIV